MSRETFMLNLSQKQEKDKGPAQPVFLMTHQIVALVPLEKGTKIITATGLPFEVEETISDIQKRTKNVGTMVVL